MMIHGVNQLLQVAVLLPNVPAMYEAHFGVPMSGAVLNSINTRLDARTVAVLLRHSGSRLVFVAPALLPLLDDALRLLPSGHSAPRVVLVEDPHEKDQFPPAPAPAAAARLRAMKASKTSRRRAALAREGSMLA